ncbi:hypothetical protein SASPL_149925 [Salvia splendens]|uniref:Uncharacterized protein n=1 Tax=Salvia splendens TaxID=180675 RepID=A0A8X8Z1A1_SALSN|nr:hypothetical protein SASPL_149925 [Salvia splendens]
MGGGDQGAQQALQNLAGLLLLPRRHRPRIRHRHLLLRGPTARLNVPDCVPEYCHQDLSAAAIRKKATEDVVLLKSLVAPPLCKKQVICRMNKEGYLWM